MSGLVDFLVGDVEAKALRQTDKKKAPSGNYIALAMAPRGKFPGCRIFSTRQCPSRLSAWFRFWLGLGQCRLRSMWKRKSAQSARSRFLQPCGPSAPIRPCRASRQGRPCFESFSFMCPCQKVIFMTRLIEPTGTTRRAC